MSIISVIYYEYYKCDFLYFVYFIISVIYVLGGFFIISDCSNNETTIMTNSVSSSSRGRGLHLFR